MPLPTELGKAKQLLVEGNDLRRSFEEIRALQGRDDFDVQNFGSITELAAFLKGFRAIPEFNEKVSHLAVIRDAELDAAAALQSVRGALERAELPVPTISGAFTDSTPRVGVLLLPDGRSPGKIETLCLSALAGEPVMACVDEFLACAERTGRKIVHREKARLQAFLATHERDPYLRMGQAFRARVIALDHGAFEAVRTFLEAF